MSDQLANSSVVSNGKTVLMYVAESYTAVSTDIVHYRR